MLAIGEYDRLRSPNCATFDPALEVRETADGRCFTVLCRIDAYADYVAEVEADTADEAAELAMDNHSDYKWEHDQTAEFDDRFYVTLDDDGNEIEGTQCGDF